VFPKKRSIIPYPALVLLLIKGLKMVQFPLFKNAVPRIEKRCGLLNGYLYTDSFASFKAEIIIKLLTFGLSGVQERSATLM